MSLPVVTTVVIAWVKRAMSRRGSSKPLEVLVVEEGEDTTAYHAFRRERMYFWGERGREGWRKRVRTVSFIGRRVGCGRGGCVSFLNQGK